MFFYNYFFINITFAFFITTSLITVITIITSFAIEYVATMEMIELLSISYVIHTLRKFISIALANTLRYLSKVMALYNSVNQELY
jgi:hypothetical protein